MKHDRSELLKRIRALRENPFTAAMLDVSLTCRMRDEELCEIVQEVLEAVERAAAYGRIPSSSELEPYDPRD